MKIEIGKHYRMRDGRVAGPVLPWDENDPSKGYRAEQIIDGYLLMWNVDGKFDGFLASQDNNEHAHLDLVEVVCETPENR